MCCGLVAVALCCGLVASLCISVGRVMAPLLLSVSLALTGPRPPALTVPSPRYRYTLPSLVTIIREEGVRALYKVRALACPYKY